MTRATRTGWPALAYGIAGTLYFLAIGAVAFLSYAATATANVWAALAVLPVASVAGVFEIAVPILAGFALHRALRLQRGHPGRGRLVLCTVIAFIHLALIIGMVATAATIVLRGGEVPVIEPMSLEEMMLTLSDAARIALQVIAAGVGLSFFALVFSHISLWFLIKPATRRKIWWVVDVVLAVAFVLVTIFLPLLPETAAEGPAACSAIADAAADLARNQQVLMATTRLVVTVLFVARVIAWLIPPLLDAVERSGFQPMVAARHLRSKKSGFLAAIGTLSVLAVAFSSCSLTTTLSVMGGFRNDLKEKILGNNAHVVVDRTEGNFEGWEPVLRQARRADGVIGATPVLSGEVMVTSASNLAGAVLRGIDPATIGSVNDLPRNLCYGRLEYLERPELLLDLSPAERGAFSSDGPPIPPPPPLPGLEEEDEEEEEEPATGDPDAGPSSVGRDINDAIDEGIRDRQRQLDLQDVLGDPGDDDDREVLPGIIVGQELARTLRLYVGDEVNVVSPFGELGPSGPMPKSRPFRVAGIFYSGMYEYDMKHAYVALETAQRFLNTGDAVSSIEIKVDNVEQAPRVAAALRRELRGARLQVRDWQELNRNLFSALALEKLAMFITLGIAILVAGFCVFGTLTLMVQEKGREVGILKAMGTTKRSIVTVFMIEGFMIGLFGSLIGLGLGFVVCFVAQHFGIRMDPQVYYIDQLPVHIDPVEFTLVGIASAVVCLIATIFPATLASSYQPVEAIRYE